MRVFKRTAIILLGVYLGMFLLTAIPTLLNKGSLSDVFSIFLSVTGWAFLLGMFMGIGIVVVANVFPPKNKPSEDVKNDIDSSDKSDESEEVI